MRPAPGAGGVVVSSNRCVCAAEKNFVPSKAFIAVPLQSIKFLRCKRGKSCPMARSQIHLFCIQPFMLQEFIGSGWIYRPKEADAFNRIDTNLGIGPDVGVVLEEVGQRSDAKCPCLLHD